METNKRESQLTKEAERVMTENDSVIMQRYQELANVITSLTCDETPKEEKIRRTYIRPLQTSRDKTFGHSATMLMKKGGIVRPVTQAIMVYPAIAWVQKAKSIDALIEKMDEYTDAEDSSSVEYIRLRSIRRMLSPNTDSTSLRLEQRERYFKRCEQFLATVRAAMSLAVENNSFTMFSTRIEAYRARQKLADILLTGVDNGELSQYCIRRYLCGLITDVANIAGKEIVDKMNALCDRDEMPDNAELAYLFHNTSILLREYNRLMHAEWCTGEKAVQSAQQLANSIHDSACGTQRCYVTEFMQLIHGCLLLLRDFPKDGAEMYDIVMHQAENTTQREYFERQLFISAPKYYRMKKQAMEILSAILWGNSAEVLFDLLLL